MREYHATIEQTVNAYTYDIVETRAPLVTAIQSLSTTHVEQVALVAITLHFEDEGRGLHIIPSMASSRRTALPPLTASCSYSRSLSYFLDHLRPLVRKTDSVFLLHQTFYFLLPGADQQGGQIVQDRLWEALLWRANEDVIHREVNNTPGNGETTGSYRVLLLSSITIGHSAYPAPCADLDQFIEAAESGMLCFNRSPDRTTRKAGRETLKGAAQKWSSPEQNSAIQQAPLPASAMDEAPTIKRGVATEEQVSDDELPALARKLGIPYLTLLPSKLPAHVQELVNPKLAHELRCYPLGRERNMLTVAMLNPQDRSVLDRLHRETGLHIFPVLTHPHALQTALEQLIC